MESADVLASATINLIFWMGAAAYASLHLRTPIYHPYFIYLIYHFLGFVARPFLIHINGGSFLWDRIGFSPDGSDILLVTAVANLSLVAVTLGVFFGSGCKGSVPMLAPIDIHVRSPKRYYLAIFLVSAAGVFATYKSIQGAGLDSVLGYETFVDDAGGRRLVGVSGYVTALAEFLPITAILLFFSKSTRAFSYAFIAAFIALRLYAGAQRLSFVVVLAALFFFYHMQARIRIPKKRAIIIILIFAFAFEIIGHDRYAFRRILDGTSSIVEVMESYYQERGGNALTSDIVEYDVSAATVSVVSRNSDYTYGTQYLRLLIWPIPRQLWPNKPVYTSIVDLNEYGDFRYLTTGVYADTFMVLSFGSMLPMMFFLGVFFSIIYRKANQTQSVVTYLFFWLVLIYIKTILRDGGVTVFYFWIFSFFAIYFLAKAGRLELRRQV